MKCLACGHDNDVGDESCASCSSSLNLRLCSACEAINANSAERCHSCGARLLADAEELAPRELLLETPLTEKVLPATWVIPGDPGARRKPRFAATVLIVPLVAAVGVGYHFFYGTTQARPVQTSLPVSSEPKRAPSPVTQTPEMPKSAHNPFTALPLAETAATTTGAPGEAAKAQRPACPPGLVALDLCSSR